MRDFESRYLSSYLGLPWAFIQPALYIFIIWFAFTFGLRAGHTASGLPYAPWLILAIIPWMFISQTMIASSNSIFEYSYIIKKTKFPITLIPIIKIFSGIIVHFILMVVITIILILFYNIKPSVYWLQFFYYLFANIVLLSGISLLVASINVFIQDMAHIVNILVSLLFWATPIVYPYSMLSGKLRYIALLNPFFYITEGYRYTFLEHIWFYKYTEMNIYFWTFTLLILFLGTFTFHKLKQNFIDYL